MAEVGKLGTNGNECGLRRAVFGEGRWLKGDLLDERLRLGVDGIKKVMGGIPFVAEQAVSQLPGRGASDQSTSKTDTWEQLSFE